MQILTDWKSQINHIKKKVNRSIGILPKIHYYIPVFLLICTTHLYVIF